MALKYKIAVAFGLLLTAIVVGFWLALKLQLQQSLNQQTETLGLILAKQTADSVTELVLANDLLGLNVVVNQLAQEPGISRVVITDVDGVALAPSAQRAIAPPPSNTTYHAAITVQDSVAGHVQLTLDENLLRNPLASPQQVFYGAIIIGLLFTLGLALFLSGQVSRPLQVLLHDIDHPDDDTEPRALAGGDIGLVQQKVYDLLNRQAELEEELTLAGLPDPSEDDTAPSPARRRLTTLLTVQVKDSQQAVELLHPATLAMLLQQYQFYLRQAARLYRGVVTRIDGDRVVVCFDARRCRDEHAFNALCCAQLFMLLMRKVALKHRGRSTQSLEFSIAVHSGEVYFSPVWTKKPKDGTPLVQQESAIGKPVDLAAELLDKVPAGQLVATAFCYQLAGGQTRFPTDESHMERIAIGDEEYSTYRLEATSGSHAELLQRQCQHMIPDVPEKAAQQ